MEIPREEAYRKALSVTQQSRICSHPIFLSLVLPSIIFTDKDQIDFTSRVAIYDLSQKNMIENWISLGKTKLDVATIEWILRDLAMHLYKYCSSDWIDTFDLIRLTFVSLRAFCKEKNMTHNSDNELNTQAKDFVDLISSNVMGFASAKGLDAYGFVHRTVEEYFVALTIIRPLTDSSTLPVDMIIERLFTYIWKPEYHEPLALAIGWLDFKWKSDDIDALYYGLMEKYIGDLPIGCLLLTGNLTSINSIRSSRMIVHLYDYILFSSTRADVSKEYLRYDLNSLTHQTTVNLFESFLHDSNRVGVTLEYLLYCMNPVSDKDTWTLPSWLSNSAILFIATWDDKDANIQTVVDLMFRRALPLPRHIDDDILRSFLISRDVSVNEIHPTILSIVIALSGGVVKVDNAVVFDPFRMHRRTPLAPFLIEWFTKEIHSTAATQNILHFIETCQTIICKATTDDMSRLTQDALVTLMILQDITQPSLFHRFSHYKAFSCALYRLKLVLYHLRQLYVIQKNTFDHCTSSFNDVNWYLNELLLNSSLNGKARQSLTIATIEACKHLTFPNIRYWKDIRLSVQCTVENQLNDEFMSYSLDCLRLILTFSSTDQLTSRSQWKRGNHPYQFWHEHPLFLAAFLAPCLGSIFERFIRRDRVDSSNSELSFILDVVLIAEVLLFLDEEEMQTFEVLGLLGVIDDIVQTHKLESYKAAIIQKIDTTRFEYNPDDNNISVPVSVDLVLVRTSIEKEQKRISDILVSMPDMKATEADSLLFSAALSIIRMCEFITEQKEPFEKAMQAARCIQNNILRILCLQHMRKLTYRWLDTTAYFSLEQILIEDDLNKSSDNLPLIIKALVFVSCIEEQENMHPLLNQLFDNILTHLSQPPKDEEDALDHRNVLQAIVGLEMQIPFSSFSNDNTPTSNLKHPLRKLFEFSNWDYPTKKFSHYRLVTINKYLYSTSDRRIEQIIPFDDHILQKKIDMRDRRMIERWISYYDDKDNADRSQIALLAVALLLRNEPEKLSSSVMERVFRILEKSFFHDIDNIRWLARIAFDNWSHKNDYIECKAWNPWMWQIMRRIWLHSMLFPKIHVELIDDINVMLKLEYDRLKIFVRGNRERIERFSFLLLIGSCSQNVYNSILTHIRSIFNDDSIVNDEYLATLIVHLVKIEIATDSEIPNEHFLVLLKTIVYDKRHFFLTQRAALFALSSLEKGRSFLHDMMQFLKQTVKNKDKAKSTEIQRQMKLVDKILILCLWALADISVEHRFVDKSFFKSIEQLFRSADVAHHAAACHGWLLWTSKKVDESVDDLKLRLGVSTDFLYDILRTKRQCTIEKDEVSDWGIYTVELIKNHWSDVGGRFLEDCYASLWHSIETETHSNCYADYLSVACELAEQEPESFCQAVRKSAYGEDAFKIALYFIWKKGNVQQRKMCIELYSTFEVITVDWIDMIFTDLPDLYCLNDELFSPLNEVENRDAIESLFPYLKCDSMAKRYFAAKCLVHLVIWESVSSLEISQLLEDILNDPTSNQLFYDPKEQQSIPLNEHIQRLLLMITCLRPIFERKSLAILTPEQVTVDFDECLDALRYPFHKLV